MNKFILVDKGPGMVAAWEKEFKDYENFQFHFQSPLNTGATARERRNVAIQDRAEADSSHHRPLAVLAQRHLPARTDQQRQRRDR